jgi:hypothetical protein
MNSIRSSCSFFTNRIVVLLIILLSQIGCRHPHPAPPFSSSLGGRYEWKKTITPTQTIAPQTTGYREDITIGSDSKGGYIAYYRNDTLHHLADLSVSYPIESDRKANSVLYKLYSGYIKIYLTFGAFNQIESISTSNIMPTYSEQADTIRSYYVPTYLEPRKR